MRVHIGNETPFNPLAVKTGSQEFKSLANLAVIAPHTPASAFAAEVALAIIHYYEAGSTTPPADIAGINSVVACCCVETLKKRADALRRIDTGDVWDTGATSLRHLMLRLVEARAAFLMRTTLH